MSKSEEDCSCNAEDRLHADIENEEDWHLDEDKFCDRVSHDDDVWPRDDGQMW